LTGAFSGDSEKILNHHELTVANELIRTSLLYEIIALLVESQYENRDDKDKTEVYDYSPEIYVNTALEYMHEHYSNTRISEVASFIGISRYYLTHIFKEKLNISPQEYLLNYRMEQGSRLLRTTSLSVQAISEKVGYENPLTFSKTFKNKFGLSPRKYREKMKEKGM